MATFHDWWVYIHLFLLSGKIIESVPLNGDLSKMIWKESNHLCLNGPTVSQTISTISLLLSWPAHVYLNIIGLLVLIHFQYSQMCFPLRFDEIFYFTKTFTNPIQTFPFSEIVFWLVFNGFRYTFDLASKRERRENAVEWNWISCCHQNYSIWGWWLNLQYKLKTVETSASRGR